MDELGHCGQDKKKHFFPNSFYGNGVDTPPPPYGKFHNFLCFFFKRQRSIDLSLPILSCDWLTLFMRVILTKLCSLTKNKINFEEFKENEISYANLYSIQQV